MNLSLDNPNLDLDLSDMNQSELIDQLMYLLKRVHILEQFQNDAFMAYPNIDLDIEYVKRL